MGTRDKDAVHSIGTTSPPLGIGILHGDLYRVEYHPRFCSPQEGIHPKMGGPATNLPYGCLYVRCHLFSWNFCLPVLRSSPSPHLWPPLVADFSHDHCDP